MNSIKDEIVLPNGGTCSLASLSDEELSAFEVEAARRRAAARERAAAKQEAERARKDELIVRNIDLFLDLYPEHDRTSCSDAKPTNAFRARCTRCVLLQTKERGFLGAEYRLRLGIESEP